MTLGDLCNSLGSLLSLLKENDLSLPGLLRGLEKILEVSVPVHRKIVNNLIFPEQGEVQEL